MPPEQRVERRQHRCNSPSSPVRCWPCSSSRARRQRSPAPQTHADDQASAQANDAAEQAANETGESNADDAADRRGPPADAGNADAQRGPPSDLPEQVPDFVSEIHSLIGQHQAGDLSGDLGPQLSELTPDEDSETADADDTDSEAPTDDADDDAADGDA